MAWTPPRWLQVLFTKAPLADDEKPPWKVILHRWMGGHKDYAPWAARFNLEIWDNALVHRLWQSLLPKSNNVPFGFSWMGRKDPGTEALVDQVATSFNLTTQQAAEAYEIVRLAGQEQALASYVGFELEAKTGTETDGVEN